MAFLEPFCDFVYQLISFHIRFRIWNLQKKNENGVFVSGKRKRIRKREHRFRIFQTLPW